MLLLVFFIPLVIWFIADKRRLRHLPYRHPERRLNRLKWIIRFDAFRR